MSERIAFRMNLNPGQASEYEKRHDEIFPELVALLKQSGISDYSIWLDPHDHHLFAILTRSDDHAMAELPEQEIMKRWWKFMSDIMAGNSDNSPIVIPLRRVFHLA
jgi:L-rhamnose mutarotase